MEASRDIPILFKELVQLPALGINLNAIGFATLTMESERYLCVCDSSSGESVITIVDLQNPNNVLKRPIAAESAVMNPERYVLALRKEQTQLQVVDLGARQPVSDTTMQEPVVYWRWLNENKMALVTQTSVYHWNVMSKEKPVKIFARHQNLQNCQIINYRVDHNEKWCVLIGIEKQGERIVGNMQLYSVDRKISQPLEGHAASFATYVPDGATQPVSLLCFATRGATAAKLYVLEVGASGSDAKFQKKQTDLFFPPEASQDFPVALQVSTKYSIIYMVTKFGYIHVFDLESATLIYMNRIVTDTIFVTAPQQSNGGILGVNKRGQVLSVTINENTIIPYICNTHNNYELALRFAARNNVGGSFLLDIVSNKFNQLFSAGRYDEAARLAAESPQGCLRTMQTIQRFQQLPATQGSRSPLLQYFSILLEKGKLNKIESLEIARPILQQGRAQMLQTWVKEEKLECSEELGDMVRPYDQNLAMSIYYLADAKDKVVQSLAATGQYDRIVAFSQKTDYKPDYMFILSNLVQTNPQGAAGFASKIMQENPGSLDPRGVVDLFMSRNMIPETTSFLLDALKGNRPEEGQLQTRLLEINLRSAPQVADVILGKEMYSHYDRNYIAKLCEQAGLFQRALEHYTDINDIKRVFMNSHAINPEFLVNYVARIPVEERLDLLRELLRQSVRQNLNIVAQIATKYSNELQPARVISMFEEFNSVEGVYLYLGGIISYEEDPEVHFKYIEAATKLNQVADVERVCRESNFYDPEKVRDFLKDAHLTDQLPLIIVCDRYDFVEDLTRYLYHNTMLQFIEAYVTQINPVNTPSVIGALIDVDCNEDFIQKLLATVRNLCPVGELVEKVEERNRLKIIQQWLEDRVAEGNQEPTTHNALAKVYVDNNQDPERFLMHNAFYDSRVVGKYCENRDPHLAFVAYKRGLCDDELIDVTNKNQLFKNQARYLVERQSPELWSKVLREDNEYCKQVLDQVIQTALPESKKPEEVSVTVKALMDADRPTELIDLLERIVLERSEFSDNRNLQNLLILTAIKADPPRVMDYIQRLDNFDAIDIAKIAESEEHKMFEEAFAIYKKFNENEEAIRILLKKLGDVGRASEFADNCPEATRPKVWSLLADFQLTSGDVKDAIGSYLKAGDATNNVQVIRSAESAGLWEDLVKYLQMARNKVKEARVESELVYSLAKLDRLAELEEFITSPNIAQIQEVGNRCFDEELYEAAKLLFTNISNFARLATTLVKLKQYSSAVEAARKANNTRTWKEVNLYLVEAKEFRLAQICALHIMINPDDLDELIRQYETRGFYDEIVSALESGLGLERAHVGMFTELAILYSKYKPEKLEEHLNIFGSRLNTPKVIRICQANHQWKQLTFLYKNYEEYDSAVATMIAHPVEAWDHADLRDLLPRVTNPDIYYRVIRFYLSEHPLLTNDLLKAIANKVDHARVVRVARDANVLAVVQPYLESVQGENNAAVNEALHDLYFEAEDHEALRHSIDQHNAFDAVKLAKRLEKHTLLEFKRIAAFLYKKNGQFARSVELSKEDDLVQDAMATAAESQDPQVVEGLLSYFLEKGRKECFSACLYTCYEFVRPDVALELAWRHGVTDFVMPYMIQVMREFSTKLDALTAKPKEDDGQPAVYATASGMPVPILTGMPPPIHTGMPMGHPLSGIPTGMQMMPPAGPGSGPIGLGRPLGVVHTGSGIVGGGLGGGASLGGAPRPGGPSLTPPGSGGFAFGRH
ncbi:Clathrin heavy chain [Balamuthia mandrillaris]